MSTEAKAERKRIVPELERQGLLTLVDRAALATYCEAWATHKDAAEDVKRNGIMIEVERDGSAAGGELLTTDKFTVPSPAVRIQKDAAGTHKAFAAEFGLTPFSRSRLTRPESTDEEASDILTPRGSRGAPRNKNQFWFDEEEADRNVRFFEEIPRHAEGIWAGAPLVLDDWQRDEIIRSLFGWKKFDEQWGLSVRRDSRAWMEIPRGNGKTELLAGILVQGLVADGEYGAAVYSGADDRDQAKIVYRPNRCGGNYAL